MISALFEAGARNPRRASSSGGAAVLLMLAAAAVFGSSPATAAGVFAFADERGELVLRDAPGEPGWRLLFAFEEGGARTMPAAPSAPGCAFRRGELPHWHGEIDLAAGAASIDPDLLKAVIWAESRCNPRALSPKGARGLMQLMPATARLYGVTDAFDPAQNVRAGARYLRDLLAYFSGNLELALAAYNAGPKSVVDARMRVPSFRETRAYVPAVLERLRALKRT